MFVREKRIGSYSYLYLVETVRENGKTKQRIIRNLGRKEVVEAGGDLDRLARSAARLSQRSMILSLVVDGSMPNLTCRRIGAPLLQSEDIEKVIAQRQRPCLRQLWNRLRAGRSHVTPPACAATRATGSDKRAR